MSELELSTMLVDLDCILDTRLGTVYKLAPGLLEDIVADGYHKRMQDKFKGIDDDVFREAYQSRDKIVLDNSIITPLTTMVSEFVTKTHKLTLSSPNHLKPKIMLNVYPFVITDDELELFVTIVNTLTDGKADIEIVSLSYEDISPKYLKDNISIYITYEYTEWLDIHSVNKNFKTMSCPEVAMLAPLLYFKDPTEIKTNPFEAMEELAAPFIGLKLIPVKNFSCVLGC